MKWLMRILLAVALCVSGLCILTAEAGDIMQVRTIGGLRIELHVLPAEPFFTAAEVKAGQVAAGMLIVGGAKPYAPDAAPRPNHHLVVHVVRAQTGMAVLNAEVRMQYQRVDAQERPDGPVVTVPVVVMQAIGRGEQSTHYGNNVLLPAGRYAATVMVNGNKAVFHFIVTPD